MLFTTTSQARAAAGAGGVARKALQVFIKDSVDLTFDLWFNFQFQALEGLKLAEKDPNEEYVYDEEHQMNKEKEMHVVFAYVIYFE